MKTQEKVKQTYNMIAEEFSKTRSHPWRNFQRILPHLQKDSAVLDLGCGNGRLYAFLKEAASIQYTGLDQAEKFIEIAKARYPEANFYLGDMSHELPEAQFDVMIAMASFHHIPPCDQEACLRLWRTRLKKDGILIMLNWNLFQKRFFSAWLNPARSSFRGLEIPWSDKSTRYYYAHTRGSLQKLLEKTGFEVLENEFIYHEKKAPFYRADNIWTLAKLSFL